jgi:carbonic anhydrase/acetyltransferase-like protein (isoleucine patch superfamily)
MKFKLTSETKTINNIILFRIEALKDFSNVKTGDKGGWVEKESNLSQEGNCWVYEDAWVYGNARVSGDASVFGDAWVSGNAKVYGDARVSENAWVSGDAQVFGNAQVCGNAKVSGSAWVSGDASVSGDAQVFGDARVCGDAWVCGKAQVSGNARVCGDAWVCGKARVSGDARMSGDAQVCGNARVYGDARVSGDAKIMNKETPKLTLEVGKTYLNGKGKKVRVVCTDMKNEYGILGLLEVEDGEIGIFYTKEGHLSLTLSPCSDDIVSEYKEPRVEWLVRYSDGAYSCPTTYETKETAQRHANQCVGATVMKVTEE